MYRLLLQIPQVGAKQQEAKKEEKAIAAESSTSRRTQAREMDLVENGWRSFGYRTDELMNTISEVSTTVGKFLASIMPLVEGDEKATAEDMAWATNAANRTASAMREKLTQGVEAYAFSNCELERIFF